MITAIDYLGAFRVYGADVLLLALGVTLVCSLLKKTALRQAPNKVYVFLPFAVGLVFYALYRMIATMSALPLTEDFAATAEGGFACGCAATLYYIVYEQFFRGKKNANPVYPLLEGFVPEEVREEAADDLLAGSEETEKEQLPGFVRETLARYAPDLTDAEAEALCVLVTRYLLTLGG